jgi:hypothetical protein
MDPRKAARETNKISGNKKLFLSSFIGLFSSIIPFQAFSGVKIILIRFLKKNL